MNIDIALNLADLFKVGFNCYAAYLGYKKLVKPITEAYLGNQKLLKSEIEREREMLNNISLSVANTAESQHKLALKDDKNIDKNVSKKIEQVTNLVTSHIVKGNDLKLLSLPEDVIPETNEEMTKKRDELQSVSRSVRTELKEMSKDELIKLIEMYGEIKEENGILQVIEKSEQKFKKSSKQA